jgi:hypothetical protein
MYYLRRRYTDLTKSGYVGIRKAKSCWLVQMTAHFGSGNVCGPLPVMIHEAHPHSSTIRKCHAGVLRTRLTYSMWIVHAGWKADCHCRCRGNPHLLGSSFTRTRFQAHSAKCPVQSRRNHFSRREPFFDVGYCRWPIRRCACSQFEQGRGCERVGWS